MKENRLIRRHCKKYMPMRHNTRVHLLVCNIQWCCNLCFVSSSQVNWQHRKRSKRRRVSWMEMDYQDYSPVMNSMYVQLGCPTWECMWGERSGTRILLKTLWRAGYEFWIWTKTYSWWDCRAALMVTWQEVENEQHGKNESQKQAYWEELHLWEEERVNAKAKKCWVQWNRPKQGKLKPPILKPAVTGDSDADADGERNNDEADEGIMLDGGSMVDWLSISHWTYITLKWWYPWYTWFEVTHLLMGIQ